VAPEPLEAQVTLDRLANKVQPAPQMVIPEQRACKVIPEKRALRALPMGLPDQQVVLVPQGSLVLPETQARPVF
jgi:hypothetical protein